MPEQGGLQPARAAAAARSRRRQPDGVLWLPLAVLAVLGHLVALYLPGSAVPAAPGGWDKVAHVLLFAVPVWLLVRLTGRALLVATAFAVHAAASEVLQGAFVPFRSGSAWDALADVLGIGLALAALRWQQDGSRR